MAWHPSTSAHTILFVILLSILIVLSHRHASLTYCHSSSSSHTQSSENLRCLNPMHHREHSIHSFSPNEYSPRDISSSSSHQPGMEDFDALEREDAPALVFDPQCFRASHYQSQYNAQLVHYLLKSQKNVNETALKEFLELKGYDFRADGCNLTMILKHVDSENYSVSSFYLSMLMNGYLNLANMQSVAWNVLIVIVFLLLVYITGVILPLGEESRSSAGIFVGFVAAFVGSFFVEDTLISFLGLLCLSVGLVAKHSKPLSVKFMFMGTAIMWMLCAIALESRLIGFGFGVFFHAMMAVVVQWFWRKANQTFFSLGSLSILFLYFFTLILYIVLREARDSIPDMAVLRIFASGWRWSSVLCFVGYWTMLLFPKKSLISRNNPWYSGVVFIQSILTFIVVVGMVLYGRTLSTELNVFQMGAMVLSCSFVMFVRKSTDSWVEMLAIALWIGVIGYSTHVLQRYQELVEIASLSR